jgi:hypothetical protein
MNAKSIITAVALAGALAGAIALSASAYDQTDLVGIPCQQTAGPAGTPTAEGLTFHGGAGDFVSAPFTLPKGTTIYRATMAGEPLNRMNLLPAPGSPAKSLDVNIIYSAGPYDGTKTVTIERAGSFVLGVHAAGDWDVALVF